MPKMGDRIQAGRRLEKGRRKRGKVARKKSGKFTKKGLAYSGNPSIK